jgi:hypothetical protein
MNERRALIVDADQPFSDLACRALAGLGFRVETTTDAVRGLETVADVCPEVVIISADAGGQVGFRLCEETKDLDSGVRVVLCAATTPWPEMEWHQGRPGHADLYLDKRGMTEPELARRLVALLGAPHPPDAPATDLDEGTRLRRQFEEARREARSPAFAGNLVLFERADDKDVEIAHLRQELVAYTQRIANMKRRRRRLVTALADELRYTRKTNQDLEVLLVSAQSDADTAREERHELEKLQELEQEDVADLVSQEEDRRREVEARLAEVEARALILQRAAEAELDALRASHREELQSREVSHQQALRRGAEDLGAVRAHAQEREREIKQQYEIQLVQAQTELRVRAEEHRQATAALEARLRREKDQAAEAAQAARIHALTAQDKEHSTAMRRAFEELGAVKAAFRDEQAAVARQAIELQEGRRHAEEAAQAAAAAADALRSEKEQALAGLVAEHAAALSARQAEAAARVAELEWALRARTEEGTRALAALEARLRADKEQAVTAVEAARARDVALQAQRYDRAAQAASEERAALRAAAEQKEQELRRQHEAASAEADAAARRRAAEYQQTLAAQEARLGAEREQALAAAQAARVQALAAQDKEHTAARRRDADELAAVQGELDRQRQDAARQRDEFAAAAAEAMRLAEEQQRLSTATESRLRGEKEQALQEQASVHAQELASRSERYEAAARASAENAASAQADLARRLEDQGRDRENEKAALASAARLVAEEHAQAIAALEAGLREGYERRLAEAEAEARRIAEEHRQALADLSARLLDDKEHAVAAMHAARSQALSAQDRDHAAALRQAADEMASLRNEMRQQQDDLDRTRVDLAKAEVLAVRQADEHQRSSAALESRLRAEKDQALEAQAGAHGQELAARSEQHEQAARSAADELAAQRADSERVLVDERRRHDVALAEYDAQARQRDEEAAQRGAALEAAHAQALSVVAAEQEAALRRAADELNGLAAAARQQEHALRQEFDAHLAEALAAAQKRETEQQRALEALEARWRTEVEHVAATAQVARVQALSAQDKEHTTAMRRAADEVRGLKQAIQQEQEAAQRLRAEMAAGLAEASRRAEEQQRGTAALEARLLAEKEQAAAAQAAAHAQELAAKDAERDEALRVGGRAGLARGGGGGSRERDLPPLRRAACGNDRGGWPAGRAAATGRGRVRGALARGEGAGAPGGAGRA